MEHPIIAICVLSHTNPGISGTVEFKELSKHEVQIKIDIQGLTPGKHGFHIHEAGDLTDNCKGACSHFNPTHKTHGGPKDKQRHVGDLGNITANKQGIAKKTMKDHLIKLRGKHSIIGRAVVIHEDEDDCGVGGIDKHDIIIEPKVYEESLKTGNAGKRIACGVIGYSKKMC